MDDKKGRILDVAWKKFMEKGYSNVTMDEIARECGFGKATVYKFFESKELLLLESIEYFTAAAKQSIDAVLADETVQPTEKLEKIMKPLLTSLSRVNAAALGDIRRNAPEAFDLIDKKRREMIFQNITKIIGDGQKSGAFRKDVDAALVAHIIIGAVSHITSPDVMSTFNLTPAQILNSIVSTVINGVTSCTSCTGGKPR